MFVLSQTKYKLFNRQGSGQFVFHSFLIDIFELVENDTLK